MGRGCGAELIVQVAADEHFSFGRELSAGLVWKCTTFRLYPGVIYLASALLTGLARAQSIQICEKQSCLRSTARLWWYIWYEGRIILWKETTNGKGRGYRRGVEITRKIYILNLIIYADRLV